MSLLLEALKKAERAKEEAQRRASGNPEADAPGAEPPEAGPVRTRDQLPDINQPLEIAAEEPSAPRAERPPLALAEDARAGREPPRAPRPQPATQEAQSADRAAARKVFEAKFREPNPRLPFFITLGALGAFAVGTGVYFWIQLRPPPALVTANPPRQTAEAQVAAAEPKVAGEPAAPRAAQTPAISGLPAAAPATPPAPPVAPAAKPAPAPRAVAEVPRIDVPRLQSPPRQPAAPETEVRASRPPAQVHPRVESAYSAYVAGDLAAARTSYQEALREEPSNRDALLGVAALDVRAGRFEAAEAAYLRLLQADPRDAHAHAALIALRAGRADPLATESRVKSMLAESPGAHVLNFTLGNQLAQQGRWAEAQQHYFKALSAEPDNADFAYNLAVSLDHLRQPKLALEYYRRALALAKTRGASFDAASVESRTAQLSR